MLSDLRAHFITRLFCFIFGLYLLNIGVDAPDLYEESVPEDLSFNDQESLVEIFIEKILGFEDAIKEYDDNDTKNSKNPNKRVNIDQFIFPALTINFHNQNVGANEPFKSFLAQKIKNIYLDTFSPPPEFLLV